jgi:glucose/arabinose dehydrogenase
MHINFLRPLLIALMMVGFGSPLFAAVQLTPVVTGLASPIFVGHAGDGSGRLFIVEQAGRIRVLQPGSSTPTLFLDIAAKVVSGGERGLLGLAFHPGYPNPGRFFVYYTQAADGAIVIAEYSVSSNPDVANTTEKVLLTIPHPGFSNHNGGMLAFGPDGFLYAGVGDGGGGNDPGNNAQNVEQLLGKILRIDINPPQGSGLAYVSPPTNPFYGALVPGRDEIFALGMRNPWRFSFDRLTGQQWVADVGQGSREEVDTPIVNGGNYGWRVYEGTACTNVDPGLCNPANYIAPVFEYTHVNGRCSITGGYVYRGSQNVFPAGTYVYGDYCTGEIFTWNGSAQALLLDTTLNISSFGEDEAGELYVVNLGGSISRLTSTQPCSYQITPTSQSAASGGGTGFTVGVTAGTGCGWTAVSNASWLQVTGGSSGTSNGTVTYSVAANTSTSSRQGTMTIAGQTFTVNQSGAPASCSFSISPKNVNVPRQGGAGSVTVTAPPGCNWTAVSNNTWIIVTGGASGSGSGTVTYSVQASTGRRNGSITIAGRTFQVKQR